MRERERERIIKQIFGKVLGGAITATIATPINGSIYEHSMLKMNYHNSIHCSVWIIITTHVYLVESK